MTTINSIKNQITFSEVYYTDIQLLKKEFLQLKKVSLVTEEFGLPFLLIKNSETLIAFASLVISKDDAINFSIFNIKDLSTNEEYKINKHVEDHFLLQKTANFTNSQQLKQNINNLLFWLNS